MEMMEWFAQILHERFFGHRYCFNAEYLVFECRCGSDWWPDWPVPEDVIGCRRGPTRLDHFEPYAA